MDPYAGHSLRAGLVTQAAIASVAEHQIARHSGFGYMTPHCVHYRHAETMLVTRKATVDATFLAHLKRVKSKNPHRLPCPPQHRSTRQHRTQSPPANQNSAQKIHDTRYCKFIGTFRAADPECCHSQLPDLARPRTHYSPVGR